MTKRENKKYPNLHKEVNTKSRSDFIETDYIDGVKNDKGELVIRPLNDEEKAWLDQFYGESVVTSAKNLNPTKEIKKYCKEISNLRKKIAKERKEKKVKQNKKIKFWTKKIKDIEKCLHFLREEAGVFYPSPEQQRKFYKENNERNTCIYNNLKSRGMLLELTAETYDTFISDYWDIITSITGEDSQDRIIEEIEKKLRGNFLPNKLDDSGNDSDDS